MDYKKISNRLLILGVDTVGEGSVTLLSNGEIIAKKEIERQFFAEQLFPTIEDIFSQTDFHLDDVDIIASSIGPGSFTSVRIGIAATRGISIVKNIQTTGITALEVTAWNTVKENSGETLVILNAMRGQVYTQKFSGIEPRNNPTLINIEDIPNIKINTDAFIAGNCPDIATDFFPSYKTITSNSSDISFLTEYKLHHNKPLSELKPLYIRKPDAKLPKCSLKKK